MKSQSNNARQQGFSLVELTMSMAIFLVVSAAMYGTLEMARRSRTTTGQRTDLMKNMRVALTVLGRDTFNAGYRYPVTAVLLPDGKISSLLSIPPDPNTTRDLCAPVIAGKEINNNSLSGNKTDQVTFLYQDDSFNQDASLVSQALAVNPPIYISAQGLDEIVPVSGNAAACRVKDIMLVTGRTSATIAVVTNISGSSIQFGSGDVLGLNTPSASDNPMRNITVPASMRRLTMVTYRVLNDGTLVRTVYANDSATTTASPSRDQPLVYGVESMVIEYVMENGTVSRNPTAGPDGVAGTNDDIPSNQGQVRQVRATLTVRSTEKDSRGQFYKITMSATFDTRNLGYDAA